MDFLLEAMRCEYRIAPEHYDEFYWKLVRPKLADFLADDRKRDRKKKTLWTTKPAPASAPR
jgi:hypothetical protein